MFDLDAGKLVVFGIVALAVIPPKDLPRVLRTVGKYVGQMRRMASDFQGQFAEAIKEAELDSVRKEIDEINKAAKIDTSFDPVAMMRDNMHQGRRTRAEPPTRRVKVELSSRRASRRARRRRRPRRWSRPEKAATHST